MFTRILNLSIDAYDFNTGKFIGEARFAPTQAAEGALLNWINYGVSPPSLVMLESSFQPSENYIPIVPNETYHQKGVFKALLKEGDSGEWFPIEAHVTYDWRSRSPEPGNFISSVEFSNIKVDGEVKIGY